VSQIASRRRRIGALAASLITAASVVVCVSSSAATSLKPRSSSSQPVSIALEYTPGADNEAVYIAQEKGWFKRDGISVQVVPFGKTRSDVLAATGRTDFAIAASEDDVLLGVARGEPITAVLALAQHDPTAIGVLASSNIRRPSELTSGLYGGYGSAKELLLLKVMIRNNGGTGVPNEVILGTASYSELEAHRVSSAYFYTYSDVVQAEEAGVHLRLFLPRDYGVPDQYGPTVVVNNSYLSSHRALAQKFVQDLQAGLEYEYAHPTQAADILLNANHGLGLSARFIKASTKLFDGGFVKPPSGQIGSMDEQMWSREGNFLISSGQVVNAGGAKVHRPLNYKTIFTNAFL
jgi:ABC-type nitrate/sulfonate/bicarbonate transport system substrate-binding protein